MLRLSRRLYEDIAIEAPNGDVIVVRYMGRGQNGGQVELGIEAPASYSISRPSAPPSTRQLGDVSTTRTQAGA